MFPDVLATKNEILTISQKEIRLKIIKNTNCMILLFYQICKDRL